MSTGRWRRHLSSNAVSDPTAGGEIIRTVRLRNALLPSGLADNAQTAARIRSLQILRIRVNGGESFALGSCDTRNHVVETLTFETLEDALSAAQELTGVAPGEWKDHTDASFGSRLGALVLVGLSGGLSVTTFAATLLLADGGPLVRLAGGALAGFATAVIGLVLTVPIALTVGWLGGRWHRREIKERRSAPPRRLTIVASSVAGFGLMMALSALAASQLEFSFSIGDGSACRDSDVDLVSDADSGDLAAVIAALEGGADPNRTDEDGNSPLACAGPRGRVEVVEALLDAGADPETVSRDDDPVLADAALFCQPAVLDLLLSAGAPPETSTSGGTALLEVAVGRGDVSSAEVLLDHGADPDSWISTGRWVLFSDDREDTSGCPPPSPRRVGFILLLVLDRGANPDPVLAEAARQGSSIAVEAALDGGADPDSGFVSSDVTLALCASRDEIPDELDPGDDCGAVSQLMVLTGADLGFDPHEYLLPSSTLPTTVELVATPALLEAAWTGEVEIVDLLLGAGADPNAVSSYGFTALHAAAASGDAGVVQALLEAGATPPATEAPPPSAVAAAAGHTDLADLLRAIDA